MVERMSVLSKSQKGFIGMDSVQENKNEIAISYWRTMENIKQWSMNEHHAEVKNGVKTQWYDNFTVRICEVKREYAFDK